MTRRQQIALGMVSMLLLTALSIGIHASKVALIENTDLGNSLLARIEDHRGSSMRIRLLKDDSLHTINGSSKRRTRGIEAEGKTITVYPYTRGDYPYITEHMVEDAMSFGYRHTGVTWPIVFLIALLPVIAFFTFRRKPGPLENTSDTDPHPEAETPSYENSTTELRRKYLGPRILYRPSCHRWHRVLIPLILVFGIAGVWAYAEAPRFYVSAVLFLTAAACVVLTFISLANAWGIGHLEIDTRTRMVTRQWLRTRLEHDLRSAEVEIRSMGEAKTEQSPRDGAIQHVCLRYPDGAAKIVYSGSDAPLIKRIAADIRAAQSLAE